MKPNTVKSALRLAFGGLSLGILTACGGASVDVGTPPIADGGIRGTGSSVGPVSGFGSVFVNGIKFETDGNVVSNDGIASETELQKGMILRIEGEWREDGTGEAQVVEYDDTFRGQVTNFTGLDLEGAGSFEILGQTITISPQTVIRPAAGEPDLLNDDFVRVSAWRDGPAYRASLVEVIGATTELEIEGPVDSVNTANKTFAINGQTVRYDFFDFRDGLTEADLSGGSLFVEVEGSFNQLTGEIVASEVGLASDRLFEGTSGEDIEITGPVNDFTPGGDTFSINGIPVDILDDTLFDDLGPADLVNGLLVEVEGDVDQGRVQAREISLREGNAEVKGPITLASPDPLTQTFEVGGVRVQLIAQTLITDGDGTAIRRDFGDLIGGLDVEVEGIELTDDAGDTFIQALKIEVEPEDGPVEPVEFELEGKLQDLTTGTLTALDVTIQIPDESVFKETDTRDNLQTLLGLGQNPLVEVEYSCDAQIVVCTAQEIEQD